MLQIISLPSVGIPEVNRDWLQPEMFLHRRYLATDALYWKASLHEVYLQSAWFAGSHTGRKLLSSVHLVKSYRKSLAEASHSRENANERGEIHRPKSRSRSGENLRTNGTAGLCLKSKLAYWESHLLLLYLRQAGKLFDVSGHNAKDCLHIQEKVTRPYFTALPSYRVGFWFLSSTVQ